MTRNKKKQNTQTQAVTYCRVSSQKQVTKGDGLGSQETRCSEYAKYKGYKIVEVFRDEGVSGGLIERAGMQAMLTYIKKHSKQRAIVVIIDDISRLARGLDAHIQLRNAINTAGGRLESPSIEFGEDSDSILVENLLASVSQHARQKNAEQVVHRMRARIMNGYWCFRPIIGYKYKRVRNHGQMLVRDEPIASIITEALEGFAAGRFATPTEMRRFLEAQPAYPKDKTGKVHSERVYELCRRSLYAGYIEVPKWGISLLQGKHEPFISFETWQKIQVRIKEKAKAPARKDISEDFPLRGIVSCACCNHPMTSAWSQGRSRKYAYYFCQNKACKLNRKSIKRDLIESKFDTFLKKLSPAPSLFKISHAMLSDLWEHQESRSQEQIEASKIELANIDSKRDKLVDKIVETDNQTLISAYETKINKLEETRVALSEKIEKCGRPVESFDQTYRTAMQFLLNPYKLWESGDIEDKRLVLRLTFSDYLPYDLNKGYRTAKMTLPFSMLANISKGKKDMVEPDGIEPTTSCMPCKRSPN
jgi:site-specific DNA recombinase